MPRTALAALLVASALLAGCSGSDDPQADPSSSPTESATSGSVEPTPSEPTVAPATGPLIDKERVRMRVPEGWDKVDAMATFHQMYADPNSFSNVSLGDLSSVGDLSIQQQARNAADLRPRARIEEPVEIAGVEWFHLSGRDSPQTTFEVFGTVHNGSQATIEFALDKEIPPDEQQQLIDSVLATVEWK